MDSISIPVYVSELPVRSSEIKRIESLLMEGIASGILNPGTCSSFEWSTVKDIRTPHGIWAKPWSNNYLGIEYGIPGRLE